MDNSEKLKKFMTKIGGKSSDYLKKTFNDLNGQEKVIKAKKKLVEIRKTHSRGKDPSPTTIGEEKSYNPFLRLDSPEIKEALRRKNKKLGGSPLSIFKEMRKQRDGWK